MALGLVPATWAQSWSLTGNAGTNPSTNFLGTTDVQPLKFRVNNTASGTIDKSGLTSFGYAAGGSGLMGTAMGYLALNVNTGYENVAVGAYALQYNSNGGYNVATG